MGEMSGLSFTANNVAKEVREAFIATHVASSPAMFSQIERAATGAIRDAATDMKTRGRANIAGAGFSKKWQNAWRVNVYPKSGYSLKAAAYGFHKIPYSLVFESGATIRAKRGLLWIPLPTVPKKGQRRMTARQVVAAGVKLISIARPGKRPLLAASLRLTGTQQGKLSKIALTLSKLKKGTAGKRGEVQAVPLFYGLNTVTLRKRFNISGVADSVSAGLPDLYLKHVGV
jgi:hypothetical protein